jgi:hypothetical protein
MIAKQRKELRRWISEMQRRKPQSRRYPEDVRQAVLTCVRECRGAGRRHRQICRELALSPATVKRWERCPVPGLPPEKEENRFRPVVMAVAASARETALEPESTFCSLTSPAGYRVDGLGIDQVVYLLRELR